jgi:hypothetical protein
MLGRGGSVLDLAAHCNRLSPRPGNLTRFQGDAHELPGKTAVDRKPPAMVHARLARSLDRARERGQRGPFSRHRGGASCQGSRCNTGAAPATVTGDKVRQIHWAKSLGRAGRRTIRQARRPTALVPALSILGSSVRLAIPRGAEARRQRPRCASVSFHFWPRGIAYPPPRVAFGCSGGWPATAEQYKAWQSSTY